MLLFFFKRSGTDLEGMTKEKDCQHLFKQLFGNEIEWVFFNIVQPFQSTSCYKCDFSFFFVLIF